MDRGAQRHPIWIVFHAYASCVREACARSFRWALPCGDFALCLWADVQANARKLATCPATHRLLAASPLYRSVLNSSIVHRETPVIRARCRVVSRDFVRAAINHRLNRPHPAVLAARKRRRCLHDLHQANGLATTPRPLLSSSRRSVAGLANSARQRRNHRHQQCRHSLEKTVALCVYRLVLVSGNVGTRYRHCPGRSPGTCRPLYLSSADWIVHSGELERS